MGCAIALSSPGRSASSRVPSHSGGAVPERSSTVVVVWTGCVVVGGCVVGDAAMVVVVGVVVGVGSGETDAVDLLAGLAHAVSMSPNPRAAKYPLANLPSRQLLFDLGYP